MSHSIPLRRKNGKQKRRLQVQIRAIACLMFSFFSRNPVLKGFNKAWYLSTASTVRVIDETAMAMLLRTVNLQANLPNPSDRSPTRIEAKHSGPTKTVMISLPARFAKRKLVVVCIARVLCTIRMTNILPTNPAIKKWNETPQQGTP